MCDISHLIRTVLNFHFKKKFVPTEQLHLYTMNNHRLNEREICCILYSCDIVGTLTTMCLLLERRSQCALYVDPDSNVHTLHPDLHSQYLEITIWKPSFPGRVQYSCGTSLPMSFFSCSRIKYLGYSL